MINNDNKLKYKEYSLTFLIVYLSNPIIKATEN